MSGKLAILFTAAAIAGAPTAGSAVMNSFYCAKNAAYINLGDSPAEVEQACGKPDSTQVVNSQSSQAQQVQQWIYYRNGQSMVVNVANNQVQSLNVSGQDLQNSGFCNSAQPIAVGNAVSQLRSSCNAPVLVRNVTTSLPQQTTQQMQWTYNQGYMSPLTLVFQDFKLVSIQQ